MATTVSEGCVRLALTTVVTFTCTEKETEITLLIEVKGKIIYPVVKRLQNITAN